MLRLLRNILPIVRLGEATCECFPVVSRIRNTNEKASTASTLFKPTVRSFCTSEQGPVSESDIAELSGGDPELEQKLRVLILETEVWRQEGKAVPNNDYFKKQHWGELLELKTKSARRRYLEFLFKIEKKKENTLRKKEEKRLQWEQTPKPEREADFVKDYTLGGNNILLRVYDTTINQLYNNRLVQAMQFGQKLVVDCGYYNDMNERENKNCAKQLMLLFAENRCHDEPFDLHFCNVSHDSVLIKGMHKFITTMYEPWFPLHFHEKSYLSHFPKEKLVYLTPHCRDTLTEFNHDDIYIIGAIVDKVNNEPLSLAKAKREGIRMAKLPLDNYLQWGSGSGKSLTLNQVAAVMLDAKKTGNWQHALRHVPRRKVVELDFERQQQKFNSKIGNFKTYRDEEIGRQTMWKPSFPKRSREEQPEDDKERRLKLRDVNNTKKY